MTFPVHTTKHMGSGYRKLNIFSAVFTLITLVAALMAALSGIQLFSLKKKQTVEAPPTPPIQAPATVDNSLNKEIQAIKAQLAKEKEISQKLKSSISKLKKQKSALEKAIAATKTPKPVAPAPTEKTITAPTAEEPAVPGQSPEIESNPIAPAAPKPAAEITPTAPNDSTEPSTSAPQNAPLPDQPPAEEPAAPMENTEPPASQPEPEQRSPEHPQPQEKPAASPSTPNEPNEAKPLEDPTPEASTAPVVQTPNTDAPSSIEKKPALENTEPKETPEPKSP